MTPEAFITHFQASPVAAHASVTTINGELVLTTTPAQLVSLLTWLRDDSAKFSQLVDVTAVDYPSRPERFELAYMLLSIEANLRVRVK